MTDQLRELNGIQVLRCAPDGPPIDSEQSALDVIGNAYGREVAVVAVPAQRLAPDFFQLRTGLVGAIAQKFVNYRLRLVVLGDVSVHAAASPAFASFVTETNRGDQLWFLADERELASRLGGPA